MVQSIYYTYCNVVVLFCIHQLAFQILLSAPNWTFFSGNIHMHTGQHVNKIYIGHIIIIISSNFIGDVTIPGGMTLTVDSDLNGTNPQFTLTCISTGGPATTVTWTRNSEVVNGTTVLDDAETAQYIHTLTVTGRLGGLYQCTVENAKPSLVSASFFIQGRIEKHIYVLIIIFLKI